ncbi:MAG: hypothetical protein QXU47_02395 [Candidatus Bathyarchaeia archaeon]
MSRVLGPKTHDLYEGCEVFPSKKIVKAKTSMVGDPRMSGFPPPPPSTMSSEKLAER